MILAPSHSLSWYPDPPSADREDIDTVIGEVAKDAEAEADKIAAEEAAKIAAEEAAKGPAGEAGKAAAEEGGKGPAGEGVADDQPSSPTAPGPGKYLKVGCQDPDSKSH